MKDSNDGTSRAKKISEPTTTHYRRCHICNEVSQADVGAVKHCGSCGKAMAPFFFFEEIDTPIASEFEVRPAHELGQHPPVRGLTAYW